MVPTGQVDPEQSYGAESRFIPCQIRKIYVFEVAPVKNPNIAKRVLTGIMMSWFLG